MVVASQPGFAKEMCSDTMRVEAIIDSESATGTISECVNSTTAALEAQVTFWGIDGLTLYPEAIYNFTPAYDGGFYLDTSSLTNGSVSYLNFDFNSTNTCINMAADVFTPHTCRC